MWFASWRHFEYRETAAVREMQMVITTTLAWVATFYPLTRRRPHPACALHRKRRREDAPSRASAACTTPVCYAHAHFRPYVPCFTSFSTLLPEPGDSGRLQLRAQESCHPSDSATAQWSSALPPPRSYSVGPVSGVHRICPICAHDALLASLDTLILRISESVFLLPRI